MTAISQPPDLLDKRVIGNVLGAHLLPRYGEGARLERIVRRWSRLRGERVQVLYELAVGHADGRQAIASVYVRRPGNEPTQVAFPGAGDHWRDEALQAEVYVFPSDPVLSQLPRLVDPTAAAALVGSPIAEARVLRYKPEKRCVIGYRTMGRAPGEANALVAKVYAEDRAPAAFELLTALHNAGAPVPRPLRCDAEKRVLFTEHVAGPTLERLRDVGGLRDGVAPAGRALRALHDCRVGSAPSVTRAPRDEARGLRRLARYFAADWPQLWPGAEPLVEATAEALERVNGERRVVVHGEFDPGQVILGPPARLVDLDSCALAHPGFDIGRFLAYVDRLVLAGRWPSDSEGKLQDVFLEAYGEADESRQDPLIGALRASNCLRLAFMAAARRRTAWEGTYRGMRDRAHAALTSVGHPGCA
jgi:aminoglycoside phosphotransferase (APT) family kinase protein